MILKNSRDRKKLTQIEKKLSAGIVRVFNGMRESLENVAEDYVLTKTAETPIDMIVNLGFLRLKELFDDSISAGYVEGAMLFQEAGIEINLEQVNKRAIEYTVNREAMYNTIGRTTRAGMEQSLRRALQEEITFQEYRQEVANIFILDKKRADLIAVNEIGEAYSQANQDTARDLQIKGFGMLKQWDTVGDRNVTRGCSHNESLGWKPIEYVYQSIDGIGKSQTDRPTRFPGCRCTLDYDVED